MVLLRWSLDGIYWARWRLPAQMCHASRFQIASAQVLISGDENIINSFHSISLYLVALPRSRTCPFYQLLYAPLSCAGPLPYVLNHDAQYPTIDGKERQPRHEEAREKRTLAQEFQFVGLLEPEPLRV